MLYLTNHGFKDWKIFVYILSAKMSFFELIDAPNDICNDYDVRIVDGPTESDGIVQVCYKGHWGTVCASSWNAEEALVVCRQLGYTVLDTFYSRTSATSVSDQIVEDLSCTHNHFSLSNCDVTFGNPVNCTFNAGLSCSGEGQ